MWRYGRLDTTNRLVLFDGDNKTRLFIIHTRIYPCSFSPCTLIRPAYVPSGHVRARYHCRNYHLADYRP